MKVAKRRVNKQVKNSQDMQKSNKKMKLPYVFIREALEGETSIYQLNFFDKIKRLVAVMDKKSGREARRAALKARKEQDVISSLQITSSTFLREKVYERLKSENNPDGQKVIDVQLDPKFDKVKGTLISNADYNMEVRERPINKNYLKYTDKIPIRIVIEKKNTNNL